jgi:predicted dehydrogenase
MTNPPKKDEASRRDFIKLGAASVVAGSALTTLNPRMAHAAGDDLLKVGVIGCGGRGSGAVMDAMNADPNVKLVAMADLFEDQLKSSRLNIQAQLKAADKGDKFAVQDDHCFTGFDAYKQLLATDVDVVLLATTPHFRPQHLAACIEAGKHVFCEKPVAVDGPGVRSVLQTVEKAREKDLTIVSGLCWRYAYGVRETVNRIKDGAIGDLVTIHTNYLTGPLWHKGRRPEWSEMEYQQRNWLYFTWLSGDHIVEQHVHSLDKAVWLMNDQLPQRCFGLGGRQVRTEEKWGNIYDHHAVCYEYENGLKVFAYTRQQAHCKNEVNDFVYGTNGVAILLDNTIRGANTWKYEGPNPSMYAQEHRELFAGIRSGNHINNGEYMARSTLMAIMGRMACYTGQLIEADQALNSKENFTLDHYEFGDVPIKSVVAMPGQTPFV